MSKQPFLFLLSAFLILGMVSCSQKADLSGDYSFENQIRLPFDLQHPISEIVLPSELTEISGIGVIDSITVACVQDEVGRVYIFNLEEKKISTKFRFYDDGDFEGIEVVNGELWALRSNGALFKFSNNNKKAKATKFETGLNENHDTEGLAYDSRRNALLIACKGFPARGKELKGYKAIYSFNLDSLKLNKEPLFLISPDSFQVSHSKNRMEEFGRNLSEFFDPGSGQRFFQPSGIAIHPISHHIYLVAHIGKKLIILDEAGNLINIHTLDSEHFQQPEGITFLPDGDMIISNEGNGKEATLLRFNYEPSN